MTVPSVGQTGLASAMLRYKRLDSNTRHLQGLHIPGLGRWARPWLGRDLVGVKPISVLQMRELRVGEVR